MPSMEDLLPGDIMFAMHVQPRSADLLILAGQLTLGHPGYPHHVGVVSQAATGLSPALLVQAMPGGATEVEVDDGFLTKDHIYLRPKYEGGWFGVQARLVGDSARKYKGIEYSYADYVAIAGLRLGVRNGLVRQYVTTSKHMICSQLADQAMCDAGYHVFNDKRLSQDVVPSDLFAALMGQGALML